MSTWARWWWIGTIGMIGYRLYLWVAIVERGGMVNNVLAFEEGAALVLGVANLWVAKYRDYSWGGLYTSCAYALGVLLLPSSGAVGHVYPIGAVLVLGGFLLSAAALLVMGARFTVGGSAWVSLCDRGPYRWVRHPQLCARLLLLVGAACSQVGWPGLAALGVCGLLTLSVMAVEERALRAVPAYQEYRRRVRFALVPGVL